MGIREDIENYQPVNAQEEADRRVLLAMLGGAGEAGNVEAFLTRDNEMAHITVSGWVTDPTRTKVLMVYHNIYDSWSWLGGHADGEQNLLSAAIREVQEESGLEEVRAISEDIFSIEILPVSGHIKKGKYVPSHLHLNVTYLLEADPAAPIRKKEDENQAVAWFGLDEAMEASKEEWFKERIYSKLIQKMKG